MNIGTIIKDAKNNKKKQYATKGLKKIKGLILHEDTNVVSIATFNSKNAKTGDVIQIWTLYKHLKPTDASLKGLDVYNCGNCKHRHFLKGACYVNLGYAPNAIWNTYNRGVYRHIENVPNWLSYFKNRNVRFGAYGDPAFIPLHIIQSICSVVNGWTGYTHQWQEDISKDYLNYFMASVDNQEEHSQALELGYRSFKIVTNEYELDKSKEIVCPNLTHNIQCIDCGLCNGTNLKAKDIVVLVHGTWAARF